MGIKHPIYKNGITYFLTKSKTSYDDLANDLTEKINSELPVTPRRVKDLAKGLSPHQDELDALCLLNDKVTNWRELYFPNTEFTLLFIKDFISDDIHNILKGEQIDTFVKNRSLLSLYTGLMDKDAPIKTLESILVTQIYFKLRAKDLISSEKHEKYTFPQYKKRIESSLFEKLNQIDQNSILIQELTIKLKETITKSGSNRANIKRVVLKDIINVMGQL